MDVKGDFILYLIGSFGILIQGGVLKIIDFAGNHAKQISQSARIARLQIHQNLYCPCLIEGKLMTYKTWSLIKITAIK